MADTIEDGTTYTSYKQWAVGAGDRLILRNVTLKGCKGRVSGAGSLLVEDLLGYGPTTGGFTVDVLGSLNMTRVSLTAGYQDPANLWSGLTVRGAVTGTLQTIKVVGFAGNGVLCEPTHTIDDLDFIDIYVKGCRGAMWLLNVTNCTVSEFKSVGSNYPPSAKHAAGVKGHPCIIDELYEGPPDRIRPVGTTVFKGIRCRTAGGKKLARNPHEG